MKIADQVDPRKLDLLWWKVYSGLQAVTDEIEALSARPQATRDIIYGPGVLESYQALRDDLAELTDHDLSDTPDDDAEYCFDCGRLVPGGHETWCSVYARPEQPSWPGIASDV